MKSTYQERPLAWLLNLPERTLQRLIREELEQGARPDQAVRTDTADGTAGARRPENVSNFPAKHHTAE